MDDVTETTFMFLKSMFSVNKLSNDNIVINSMVMSLFARKKNQNLSVQRMDLKKLIKQC